VFARGGAFFINSSGGSNYFFHNCLSSKYLHSTLAGKVALHARINNQLFVTGPPDEILQEKQREIILSGFAEKGYLERCWWTHHGGCVRSEHRLSTSSRPRIDLEDWRAQDLPPLVASDTPKGWPAGWCTKPPLTKDQAALKSS